MDNKKSMQWLLRIGVFLTFLGHGVFALKGNPNWIPYLEIIGFSTITSQKTMFYIGVLDIIVAVVVLIKPNKLFILWAFLWAFLTALIRPIAGEPIWAFVERGANWIVPLCLYYYLYHFKKKY